MAKTNKKSFFLRYWWIFAGLLSAVALSTALNISNTDGWIVVTNSTNESYVINWNTTRPDVCTVGNYSRWNGSGFSCSPDTTGGSGSGDGNGGWTNTTTQTTTSLRVNINSTDSTSYILNVQGQSRFALGNNQIMVLNDGGNASGVWGINGGFVGNSGFNNIVSRSNGIKFYTGSTLNSMTLGTERGVINATNGFWGVNISQPTSLLHVFGDINATRLCIAGDCRSSWTTSSSTAKTLDTASYYYRSYEFESVTAAYGSPWVPTAIGSGTTALIAGEAARPGLATISSSTTASSGYSYQITGATTFLLTNSSYSTIILAPVPKTGNLTTCKLGFMDVFTVGTVVDGVYWNATQNSASTFNWTPTIATNSVETRGSVVLTSANTAQYFRAEAYVVNTTQAIFTLYNSTNAAVISQQTLNATLPSVAGRETSHAGLCYVNGGTTAQVLARLDYLGVGINNTITR